MLGQVMQGYIKLGQVISGYFMLGMLGQLWPG